MDRQLAAKRERLKELQRTGWRPKVKSVWETDVVAALTRLRELLQGDVGVTSQVLKAVVGDVVIEARRGGRQIAARDGGPVHHQSHPGSGGARPRWGRSERQHVDGPVGCRRPTGTRSHGRRGNPAQRGRSTRAQVPSANVGRSCHTPSRLTATAGVMIGIPRNSPIPRRWASPETIASASPAAAVASTMSSSGSARITGPIAEGATSRTNVAYPSNRSSAFASNLAN
jgi:hypothetical protein